MPKTRTKFVCQNCGLESPAMYGRCPECGAWSSMVETLEAPPARKSRRARSRSAALKVARARNG